MLHVVENARRKQLKWIDEILTATGWNMSRLAKEGGFSHATLSRFRNDPDNMSVLDTKTVDKIAAVAPIPHYENARGNMPAGFDEGEAEPFDTADDEIVRAAVEAAKKGHNSVEAWRLASRALENIGYLPGDILIVDFAAKPHPGDVVCAQIYDYQGGGAETTFRIYHRPYLVAASHQARHLAPTLIDDRVDVRGVVVSSIRPRMSRLAS